MRMNTGWRTVVVSDRQQMSLRNNCLILSGSNRENRIPLDQVRDLVVTSNTGNMTTSLMVALAESNVNVILCNHKFMPAVQLCGINQHARSAGCLREQISCKKETTDLIWSEIARMKISSQNDILVLKDRDNSQALLKYRNSITPGDSTNREGQAARLYFHLLFGKDFRRHAEDHNNAALNYGYSILCSMTTRLISAHGYNPALGLHHYSPVNNFNLSSDLMEPFRPFIDKVVYENYNKELDWDYKKQLINVMQQSCRYKGSRQKLETALESYMLCVLRSVKNSNLDEMGELSFV